MCGIWVHFASPTPRLQAGAAHNGADSNEARAAEHQRLMDDEAHRSERTLSIHSITTRRRETAGTRQAGRTTAKSRTVR
jgi:hypothetical protein